MVADWDNRAHHRLSLLLAVAALIHLAVLGLPLSDSRPGPQSTLQQLRARLQSAAAPTAKAAPVTEQRRPSETDNPAPDTAPAVATQPNRLTESSPAASELIPTPPGVRPAPTRHEPIADANRVEIPELPATEVASVQDDTLDTLDTPPDTLPSAESSGPSPENAPASAETGNPNLLSALLHQAIEQHKRYPLSARRMHREGMARIAFLMNPDGEVEQLHVASSSGHRSLDLAAVAAVRGIVPFAAAREHLRHAAPFEIDIIFRIN